MKYYSHSLASHSSCLFQRPVSYVSLVRRFALSFSFISVHFSVSDAFYSSSISGCCWSVARSIDLSLVSPPSPVPFLLSTLLVLTPLPLPFSPYFLSLLTPLSRPLPRPFTSLFPLPFSLTSPFLLFLLLTTLQPPPFRPLQHLSSTSLAAENPIHCG